MSTTDAPSTQQMSPPEPTASTLSREEMEDVQIATVSVKKGVLKVLSDNRFTLEDIPVIVSTAMTFAAKQKGFTGPMKKESVVLATHAILDETNLLGKREAVLLPIISGIIDQNIEVYDGNLRLRRSLEDDIRRAGAQAAAVLGLLVRYVGKALNWIAGKCAKGCANGCGCACAKGCGKSCSSPCCQKSGA
jgi:hypothetical protein